MPEPSRGAVELARDILGRLHGPCVCARNIEADRAVNDAFGTPEFPFDPRCTLCKQTPDAAHAIDAALADVLEMAESAYSAEYVGEGRCATDEDRHAQRLDRTILDNWTPRE